MIEFELEAGPDPSLDLGVSLLDDPILSLDTPEQVELSILQQGPPGPPGPTGPQGPEGARLSSYTHQQTIPAASWVIPHALNRYVSVTVIDSAGEIVVGAVTYSELDPLNALTIEFSAGFSGTAYMI